MSKIQILLVVGWLISLLGALNAEPLVAKVTGDGHNICGPWGCGPPIYSVIVWHGAIGLFLIPPAMALAARFPRFARQRGLSVLLLSVLGLAIVVGYHASVWWMGASDFARGYLPQRILFSLVAFSDLPVLPVLLAAIGYWLTGRVQNIMGISESRLPNHCPAAERLP